MLDKCHVISLIFLPVGLSSGTEKIIEWYLVRGRGPMEWTRTEIEIILLNTYISK